MITTTRTVEEVLHHHVNVLAQGLVDETVSDYALDAVILTPGGPIQGTQAIHAFFEDSVAHVLPPGSTITLMTEKIEGELALITWAAETPFFSIPFGTDTFVIRGGQIHLQTFAGVLNAKS